MNRWRAVSRNGSHVYEDVFHTLQEAEGWADAIIRKYGFDYAGGDRQEITRITPAAPAWGMVAA